MIRLAILVDCLSRNAGGLFKSVRRLAQECAVQKREVSVFGVEDPAAAGDLCHWEPLKPHVLPLCGPRFFGYAPGLVRAVKDFRPDILQVHGLWKYTTVAANRLSAALEIPYIVSPHGMLDPWAVRNSRWKKRLALWAYEGRHLEKATCLRALNRSEAEAIRAFGLRNPICIIPNGVDFPKEPSDCGKADNPFPEGRKVLLYLGRIHPKKGLDKLLEAWSLVGKSSGACPGGDPWLLAIAGWDQGGYEAKLQRQAAELGLGESVAFLGPRFHQASAACYRHCEAFVLPSLSEGLPNVVLEAWSHAKPVVMTPECNLPDGFASSAAIRIETSADGIAAGLRALLEMSDSQRQSIGQRGFVLVKDRYSWPKIAKQMLAVQEWALGRAPAPEFLEFPSTSFPARTKRDVPGPSGPGRTHGPSLPAEIDPRQTPSLFR